MTSDQLATLGHVADTLLKHANNLTAQREQIFQHMELLRQRDAVMALEAQRALTAAQVLDEIIHGMHRACREPAQPQATQEASDA